MENKNEMMVFNNEEFGNVRVVKVDGKEMFVGSDVAKALGYKRPNDAISSHCKCTVKHSIPHPQSKNKTMEVLVITEGDVYRLVAHSKLPQAERFEIWVFDELLPQIRQTGGYIPIKEEDDELTIMSKAFLIAQKTIDEKQQLIEQQQEVIEQRQEVIESQQEVIEQQQEVIESQQEVIESQRDKVDFADTVSANEYDSIDMGTMAKLLAKDGIKIGRNRLFEILRTLNILMDDNLPYQRFIDSGYFEVVEYTMWIRNEPKLCRQTLVTGKGQLYVTKKVKEYFENKNKENNKNI